MCEEVSAPGLSKYGSANATENALPFQPRQEDGSSRSRVRSKHVPFACRPMVARLWPVV